MKRAGQLITALAVMVTVTGQLQAAYMIDSTTSFGGAWTPFGESNTATYGQTFTVTPDNVLDSFSLYLVNQVANPVHFRAYVYAWDGTKATGPQLFQSALQTFTGSAAPTEFAFLTGGLSLTAGSQYVAFLNAVFDGTNSTAGMPYANPFGTNSYSGGSFVYYNNGNNFSLLTTNGWDKTGGGDDVWFKASFSQASTGAVPEPSSLALFGIGSCIAGLGAYRRRRGAQQEAAA